MDKVRFGRALGYGARHAAKAFVQAADAATSNDPKRPAQAPARVAEPASPRTSAPPTATRFAASGAAAKKSALQPLKRYSGSVLLQVVGTFFAVFALLMAQNAWKARGGMRQSVSSPDAQHFWMLSALFLLFGWFAVSSFLRARRVGRG